MPIAESSQRRGQVVEAGSGATAVRCDRHSSAGMVSQRACVFCGSRVVLYPIADALHLVHGPLGCAAYTWDIRGALSSGPQLHRNAFTTDLREDEVIHGGEKRLEAALRALIAEHRPKAAFIYSTCVVGLIGDDVDAVARRVEADCGIPVIPVASEGFKGTKKNGYHAAGQALLRLIGSGDTAGIPPLSINLVGDFNIAGEAWLIRSYFERMGLATVSVLTGDGRVEEIRRAHGARLNVVQCAGSMTPLAKEMQARWGIPYLSLSFIGIEDTAKALYEIAAHFGDAAVLERTRALVREELAAVRPRLAELRRDLEGRTAALYVGGAFKAFSLVKALRALGMRTVLAGTQTGGPDEYQHLLDVCDPGTVVVDDSNPLELAEFLRRQPVDIFIGGVKERPIAYKLGIGFCDHNHERKHGLAGFSGMITFAEEVRRSACTPLWSLVRGPAPWEVAP